MSGEIINVFVGQCGAQMSSAFWELFCVEHGIGPEGCSLCLDGQCEADFSEGRHVFFEETECSGYSPRTVIFDSESLVVGIYRSLFNPQRLMSGLEDGAGNFARGFYHLAAMHACSFGACLRRVAEGCDMLDGLCFFHSYGGGTGSGLMMALYDPIDEEYPKTTKLDFGIYPDYDQALSVLEPYNAVLGSSSPCKPDCVSLIFHNRAIINIFERELQFSCVTYSHINRLLAQVYSGLTAGLRFQSTLTSGLMELQTNLIPYPTMHYLMCSFYPLMCPAVYDSSKLTMETMLSEVLSDRFQLALSDSCFEESVMMSVALLYRGDVHTCGINTAVEELKKSQKIQFADWCPCGYKIGCCRQPMACIKASGLVSTPRCLTALYNGTLVRSTLSSLGTQYSMMKEKKAFFYWYLYEGMEECEFDEALKDFQSLMDDYEIIDHAAKKAAAQRDNDQSHSKTQRTNTTNQGCEDRFVRQSAGFIEHTFPQTCTAKFVENRLPCPGPHNICPCDTKTDDSREMTISARRQNIKECRLHAADRYKEARPPKDPNNSLCTDLFKNSHCKRSTGLFKESSSTADSGYRFNTDVDESEFRDHKYNNFRRTGSCNASSMQSGKSTAPPAAFGRTSADIGESILYVPDSSTQFGFGGGNENKQSTTRYKTMTTSYSDIDKRNVLCETSSIFKARQQNENGETVYRRRPTYPTDRAGLRSELAHRNETNGRKKIPEGAAEKPTSFCIQYPSAKPRNQDSVLRQKHAPTSAKPKPCRTSADFGNSILSSDRSCQVIQTRHS